MTNTNITKNTDPLIKRITVKEAGSILVSARAQRHNTEFPAKASIATAEYIHVVNIHIYSANLALNWLLKPLMALRVKQQAMKGFTNHIDALYFARLAIL